MAIKDFYAGDVRDSVRYIEKMSRGGLSKMPPLIITCSITGGVQGKEANPNIPEMLEEQVQQTYDAYNAGISMVHIHRRDPKNPMQNSSRWEEYLEVNQRIREKCPDLIINNTCVGGRLINADTLQISDMLLPSIPAKPEVGSIDITCLAEDMTLKARKAPLFGRDEDTVMNFHYYMSMDNTRYVAKTMQENGIKPEYELFGINDIKYLNNLIREGIAEEPYWLSMIINGNGVLPLPDLMLAASRAIPEKALFNVIGVGAAQFPLAAMAIILGHHVRVGLEDNIFYKPHELATSNAQLVERVVRLANDLGRPIATPEQAREMMGLGKPRQY